MSNVAESRPPGPTGRGARRRWLVLLAVFLAGAGLYLPTLSYEFVSWDDTRYIVRNSLVHGLTLSNLRAVFSQPYFHNYSPLHLLSYQIDYALWGDRAFGFHLHSAVLHGLNGVLVCLTLGRLGASRAAAAAAALLFAVHPSHVESVAWVSSRKDLLSLAFALLSVLAYRDAREGGRRVAWSYAGSLLCYAAAVLSKAIVVLLPFFLALTDRVSPQTAPAGPGSPRPSPWPSLRRQVPFLAVAAAVSLVNLSVQAKGTDLAAGGPGEHVLLKSYAIWRYALVLVGAAEGQPLYDPPVLGLDSPSTLAALGGFFLAGGAAAALALAWKRRQPAVLLGVGWVAAMLLPALAFPLVTFMADRYLYAPSVGFAWLLAAGIAAVPLPAGGPAVRTFLGRALLAAAAAGFVVRTAVYLPVWRDSESLWTRAAEVSSSAMARSALAAVRIRQGRFDEAEKLLRDPAVAPDADTHRMRGVLLDRQGLYREAIREYEEGIALCRRGPECSPEMLGALHFNRGVTYWHLRDYRASARAYEEAYRAAPDYGEAREWAEKARKMAR